MEDKSLEKLSKHFLEFMQEHDKKLFESFMAALNNVMATTPTKHEEEYLTIGETVKKLKISKPTLHQLRLSGKLKACLIGNRVRYRKDEIETFMNNS